MVGPKRLTRLPLSPHLPTLSIVNLLEMPGLPNNGTLCYGLNQVVGVPSRTVLVRRAWTETVREGQSHEESNWVT